MLDLSLLERHIYPLDHINEAINSVTVHHGGFTTFIIDPQAFDPHHQPDRTNEPGREEPAYT